MKQIVNNPATFTPSPYGLLSVVQFPTAPTHWQNGIVYETNCEVAGDTTWDVCTAVSGAPAPASPKEPTHEGLGLRGATPFTVRVMFTCSAAGFVDRAEELARQALDQSASWQVENAFWTGQAGAEVDGIVYPHLAADIEVVDPEDTQVLLQSVPVTGTAADSACGLGFIEQVMGDCYNGVGVIHVPRVAVPTLLSNNLIMVRGNQLVTGNGNLVAVGSGYPGTAPDGSDPPDACSTWMYATGAVFGYRTGPQIHSVKDSLDRAKNTVAMHAEQTYLLAWDCCHVAVQIDLGVPGPSQGA